ncbi:MAG: hypothetical protein HY059_19940 [Proteobacteria bacterium]|nr:hypothetical protein [Pseudomonadota bacterium]
MFLLAALALSGCGVQAIKGTVTNDAHKVSELHIVYLSRLPLPMKVSSFSRTIDMNNMERRMKAVSDAFEKQVRESLPAMAQRDGLLRSLSVVDASKLDSAGIAASIGSFKYETDDALVFYPATSTLYCSAAMFGGVNCAEEIIFVTMLYDTKGKRPMWTGSQKLSIPAIDLTNLDPLTEYWKAVVGELKSEGLVQTGPKNP